MELEGIILSETKTHGKGLDSPQWEQILRYDQ